MPYLLIKLYRELIILALFICLSISVVSCQNNARTIKAVKADCQLQQITARAEYEAKARQIEQTNYQGVIDAINESEQRQKTIAIEYNNAITANDSLSDTIDYISTLVTKDNASARAEYTAALGAVSKECGTELTKMARIAQGHANDSLMYQKAWPTN